MPSRRQLLYYWWASFLIIFVGDLPFYCLGPCTGRRERLTLLVLSRSSLRLVTAGIVSCLRASTTMAPSTQFIEQNLLDIHSRPLVVTSLFETELSEENISSFFTVKTVGDSGDAPVVADPVNIGLAGGYTPSGLLNTLAVSVGSTILLIQFRSKTKATEDAVVAARKLLQDSILCRSHVILHAFNLAPLALSLYCDHGLLLEAGVDVQSGCTCKNPRDPVDATEFATASTQAAKIYRDNIRDVFASDIRDPAKLETSRSLALRAWLAAYIPSLGDMSERLGEVPRINTRSMSADRLRLLGQFTKTGQLLDSKRPTQTAHDVKPISAIDTKVKLTSERFQTRLRATDGRIEIAVEDRHGGQYTVQASTRDVSGRLGVLKAAGAVEGKSIIAVASVDPDAQTLAEQRRDATILSVLQRTSPLFDNPFLRTIWPDSDDVIWPEETFPVSDTPPPLSYQHPLNESQQLAVEAMLSLTNTSRITVIQGPPGSGKTTVIGAFVQSAVDAGWSGIWLLAQSNVAVKNIAEKLGKIGFEDWRLLVSKDFHLGWHEHLYHQISSRTVRSDDIKKASRELKGIKVILSTLSMLSNPRIDMITSKIPNLPRPCKKYVSLVMTGSCLLMDRMRFLTCRVYLKYLTFVTKQISLISNTACLHMLVISYQQLSMMDSFVQILNTLHLALPASLWM
ncbi:hypothetical protein BC835DRAFT_1000519 [Cytidiella melzeri]|nr:hypothetical protein BC835DRAFT_1000519 [Cytidiella melzeri]